jgi:hypothetical protein
MAEQTHGPFDGKVFALCGVVVALRSVERLAGIVDGMLEEGGGASVGHCFSSFRAFPLVGTETVLHPDQSHWHQCVAQSRARSQEDEGGEK